MEADFIYQPESGQYEEISFDVETVWKSQNWCWVKFITDLGLEWIGSFRGNALKIASAERIEKVAVLTTDCLYVLNVEKKELVAFNTQREYNELVTIPTKDRFLLADCFKIGILNENFKFEPLKTEYEFDYIKFNEFSGDILNIEVDLIPDCNRVKGIVDTTNFKITVE